MMFYYCGKCKILIFTDCIRYSGVCRYCANNMSRKPLPNKYIELYPFFKTFIEHYQDEMYPRTYFIHAIYLNQLKTNQLFIVKEKLMDVILC